MFPPRYHPCKRKADFPREFKRIFDASGKSIREIAEELGLKHSRLSSIVYSRYAMDNKEFRLIKSFCAAAQEKEEAGGTASNSG